MITGGNIKTGYILHICCAAFFLLFFINVHGQTKNYATVVPTFIADTDNATRAYDSDLTTFASVRASNGIVLVSPAYAGYIELEFPVSLPPNTTSYVKIGTEQSLLGSLLGGALSGLLGAVLFGNQEFTVDVKNSSGGVEVTGDSQDAGELATTKLCVVMNGAGEYLLKITPDVAYKRIRLTNRLGSLIGLGSVMRLYVYDAYYLTNVPICNSPAYTSFSGSGTLSSGQVTLAFPERAVDAALATYSTLHIAALSGNQTIEQTAYLEAMSDGSDTFNISLSAAQAALNLGLTANVTVSAYNKDTLVLSRTLAQLLAANSLTMAAATTTTVKMAPGLPVDRIIVRLKAVSGGAQDLNFHLITKTVSAPGITAYSAICSGNTISLTATVTSGSQIRWYTVPSAGTAVATTNSGVAFTTPVLSASTTYYAEQFSGTCVGVRIAVPVIVVSKPIPGTIAGEQTICNSKQPALLTSLSADPTVGVYYRWESSLNGVDWTVVAGATSATYQPLVLLKSTFFRRTAIITASGINCESVPTAPIKVTTKSCIVYANPMVRQRIKNGA
ncbi:immunoglobulin domain-containing protein [Flavobacterium hauense]